MLKLARVFLLLGVAFSLLVASAPVAAQKSPSFMSFRGVQFPIEEDLALGNDLVKIVVGGESFIAKSSDAPRLIALRYLSESKLSKHLSGAELEQLVRASLLTPDSDVLRGAIRMGLSRESAQEFDSPDLWQSISETGPDVLALVSQSLKELQPQTPPSRACLVATLIRRANTSSFQSHISDDLIKSCIELSKRGILEAAINGEDLAQLVKRVGDEAEPVAFNEPAIEQQLNDLATLLKELSFSIEQSDLVAFENGLSKLCLLAQGVKVECDLQTLRGAFISQAVKTKAHRAALEQLARVPFEKRSVSNHQDLVAALMNLSESDSEVLFDPDIAAILKLYSAKDSEVFARLLVLRRKAATVKLERLLEDGEILEAQKFAASLAAGEVPFLTKLRLSSAKFGVSFKLLVIVFIVFLALWIAIGFRFTARLGEGVGSASVVETDVSNEPRYSAEYVAALKVFDLEPGADLIQIKNAYRALVKRHHPDLKGETRGESTDYFIFLTSEYEKLLKLFEREGRAA